MPPETHATLSARRIAQSCAAAAGLVGLASGVCWLAGPPPSVVSGPDYFLMAPLSAWLMVLLNVALFLRAGWHGSGLAHRIAFAGTATVGVMGLVVLWMRLQGLDLLLEPRLTSVEMITDSPTVGRMSPLTAVLFCMTALALACLLQPPGQWKSRALQRTATGTSVVVLLVISGILLGYSSSAHIFAEGSYMPVAMSATLNFALVALGTIALTMHGERWLCHVVGESWVGVDATSRRFRARLLVVFVALVAAIAVTGSIHLRRQTADARQVMEGELAAIAKLKADQIAAWRAERLRDARLVAHTSFIREQAQAFLNNPAAASARTDLTRWLSLLTEVNPNARLFLFDRDMTTRLTLPAGAGEAGDLSRRLAAAALSDPEPAFVDLHRDSPQARPHLDIVFGIRPPGPRDSTEQPMAVILLQLDPRAFLYPLIDSWPTPSSTAETGLLRRESDRVVLLNDGRHRTNMALNLSFPLDHPDMPAAIFMRSGAKEKMAEGFDYRGVPVLSYYRWIPDSPWVLGTKMDQEEVFASLRQQTWVTIFTLILLIAVVTLVVVLLWRQRLSDSLRRELTLERDRKQLADRLALLMRHANDIIVLADADWRIVEANERAVESYGYTLDELRRMKISELRSQESRGRFTAQMAVVKEQGSSVFEAVHRRKDGSSFRVEVSSRTVEIDGAFFYLAITRDITERRRAEQARQESERVYQSLVEHLPQAIYRLDRTGRITFANARCCEQMGCPAQDLLGKSAFDLFPAEQATRYWNSSRHVMETGATFDAIERHQRPDGRESFVHIIKSPLRGADSQIIGIQCLFWDVTERQRAEENLRASEARYRSLFENMLNGFAYCRMICEGDQPVDFVYVAVNNAFEALTGLRNVVGRRVSEVIPGIREKDRALIETCGRVARTGAPEKFETFVEAMKMWFSVSVYRPQEGYFVMVFDVITKRKEAELALRESEERYRLLADHADDIISLNDTHGGRLYISPSYYRITGWTPEEVNSTDWRTRAHPDELPMIERARAANIAGQSTLIECRIRCRDGSWIWMETRCKPLPGPDGTIEKLLLWSRDITARKEAEEAVARSRAELKAIYEHAPVLMCLLDARRRVIYANQAFTKFTGVPESDLVAGRACGVFGCVNSFDDPQGCGYGKKCVDCALRIAIEDTIQTGREHRDVEYKATLERDGKRRDVVLLGATAIVQAADQPTLLLCLVDITARKEAEDALRASQSALLMAQRLAHVGNWEWNPATDETFWSEEIFRIFGRDPKLGPAGIQDVPRYYTPESWARVRDAVKTSLAEGTSYECDAELIRDDGVHRWVTTRGEPVRAADGSIVGLRGSVQDITERKLAANEIHQLNQTLEQRVHERTAQLEASNRELESFCYSVSHDLRAPLRAVNGFASILSRDHAAQLSDEGRRTLGIVCSEALRMGQLIDDLLEFSRIGRQVMHREEINMTAVARRVFDECAAHAPGRDIRLQLHPLPPADGDPALIPHVWTNLLSNAIKYSRNQPVAAIEITGRLENGELVYSVKDNGVGFDMQYADKLFGVFQRLHSEAEFEGTGVGLALVQRIVLRHGGRVWAESRLGEGATFHFTLPAKRG